MPLRTKPKRTNAEILQERLNTNEDLRKLFESDLDKHHFRRLSDPTLRNHAMVMKHYREYSEYTRQLFNEGKSTVQPETPEIAIGTPLYAKGFARYLALALQGQDESTSIRLATLRGYMSTFVALWSRHAEVHPS
ncbi:hypothetical protein BT96DRAFT_915102, partial [Gymnopus androsaceus JB14]